jgi:cAMP-binding proteins - catabolite gene activator and regulatory subunit of cAMP-dependent protein kinases
MNLNTLRDSALFAGIAEEELMKLSKCLMARQRAFDKEAFILRAGEPVNPVYFILSGTVHIVDEDFWGNRAIIETMEKDTLFGEAYVFSGAERHLVSVVAAEPTVLLEINPHKLFESCMNGCTCHAKLTRNALGIVSEKIVRLTEKLGHIMQRTLREKLLSYLSLCSQREKTSVFDIPYSRQQLADYLCVDRSALSHELSRLQKEGLLRYQRSHFELLVNRHED